MGKIIKIGLDIFCSIFIILAIIMAILLVEGIYPMIIVSGSMEPMIPTGSICFVDTHYEYEKLKLKDVIVYSAPRQNVIHRIVEMNDSGLTVKGDANERVDNVTITKDMYVGKFIFSITQLGYITTKLQTPVAKAIFITFIIAIFVVDYLMHYAEKEDKKEK